MKKILYIGGFQLPDKNAAAHRVLANSKIFVELGAEVFLIGQDSDLEGNVLRKIDSNIPNIRMFSTPYPKGTKRWIQYIFGIDWIKKAIEEYNIDTLVLYNYPAYASLRLLPFLKKKNIKVIADCTEWYGSPEGSILKKTIKNLDTILRMNIVNFKLDGVIAISKYLYNYYSKKVNTILLPPLIDTKDNKWLSTTENINNKITMVYAGQMGRKDKINDFLSIVDNQSEKILFKVIGLSTEEYIDSSDNNKDYFFVQFLGRKKHTEVIDELKNSDFAVFFRENNRVNNAGFPTKFVEAISCGVPVITNRTSNISDFLIEGKNGFFVEDNELEKINFILNLSNKDRETMKLFCKNNNPFEYKLFIKQFNSFLNKC